MGALLNILFITSDQHRGDTLGCMGHPCVRTPHLDLLAGEGALFTQAYTNCPITPPARTSMITGIPAYINGDMKYNPRHVIARPKETLLASLLTRAGYQSCCVGKTGWQIGKTGRGGFETVVPLDRLGRERLLKTGRPWGASGIGGNEFYPSLSLVPPELHATDWIVDRCIEFLEEREDTQPFFLYASFHAPHPPNTIHEPYYSMYDDEKIPEPVLPDWAAEDSPFLPVTIREMRYGNSHFPMKPNERRKARGVYYGLVTNLDHQLGRLFGMIMRQGAWNNTLVLYTTDHGDHLGDYGMFFKGTFLEGSGHIPFIVKAPEDSGARKGIVSNAVIDLVDILPTFCEAAGAPVPGGVRGKSLWSILRGEAGVVHDYIHGQMGEKHMIHDGRHKYLYHVEDGRELLFDKSTDPLDEHNLSENETLVGPLREKLVRHLERDKHEHVAGGALRNNNRPFNEAQRTNVIGWSGLAGSL